MSSRMGSSGPEAMGHTLSIPWRGSRMRPEMNDEAAEEGWRRRVRVSLVHS
jgi:hypothetical protein